MTNFSRHEEPDIVPDDIWKDDAFGALGKYADFLTKAMVSNENNFVLNVNGVWGTGKTFFVRRWAESLRQDDYAVIEYNAWKHDSEDDPLTSLVGNCAEALKAIGANESLVKNVINRGGRVALRIGGIAVKAGLRKVLGDEGAKDINNLFSEETENDLMNLGGTLVDEQIAKQKQKESFVDELTKLIGSVDKKPVFIFIDELDRCRPTFAIELLERVKHLFDVPGIKFVMSTYSNQLSKSIQGVYGEQFDGTTYLQRFFDETFTLPEPSPHIFAKVLLSKQCTEELKETWIVSKSPEHTFGELSSQFGLTLRQQLQAYHRVMAVVDNIPSSSIRKLHFEYICFLVVFRFKYPEDYANLASSLAQTQEWNNIASKHSLTLNLLPRITVYLSAINMSRDKIAESIEELGITIHNGTGNYELNKTKYYTLSECFKHYDIFIKYPDYVEFADTLS